MNRKFTSTVTRSLPTWNGSNDFFLLSFSHNNFNYLLYFESMSLDRFQPLKGFFFLNNYQEYLRIFSNCIEIPGFEKGVIIRTGIKQNVHWSTHLNQLCVIAQITLTFSTPNIPPTEFPSIIRSSPKPFWSLKHCWQWCLEETCQSSTFVSSSRVPVLCSSQQVRVPYLFVFWSTLFKSLCNTLTLNIMKCCHSSFPYVN